jgi:membrane-associated phospholipid phosphatase
MTSKLAAQVLLGTAALAAASFAALSVAVTRGKTSRLDQRAKRAFHTARGNGSRHRRVAVAANATTPFGKWWGYVPPAMVTAYRLNRAGRHQAAITIAGSAVASAVLPLVLDRISERRLPPPERDDPSKQSYPSGHALQTSAMAIVSSYVTRRESIAAPPWAASFGLLSLATGLSRLVLDRHWLSDVLGGYLAGIALGTASAGLYELSLKS